MALSLRRRLLPFIVLVVAGGVISVGWLAAAPFLRRPTEPVVVLEAIGQFPHDREAFTQGLAFHEGRLIEGTGQYGTSELREVELATGKVLRSRPIDKELFGEGIAIHDGRIYQLTWKERVALVYDAREFQPLGHYRYSGEGWGLTSDGTHLIQSDGSATLRFIDPKTFETVRRITVHGLRGNVEKLNELEYVNGEILANIWYNDRIVRIDPSDGRVLGWLDAGQLYPRLRRNREHVLNGIAWDPQAKRLFVTGKNWPTLFEVKLP